MGLQLSGDSDGATGDQIEPGIIGGLVCACQEPDACRRNTWTAESVRCSRRAGCHAAGVTDA
jgi:hypothetical protein